MPSKFVLPLVLASVAACASPAAAPVSVMGAGTTLVQTPGDAVFRDYRFADGETLPEVHIHYVTAGTAHRDAQGRIDNAVLILHWTSTSSAVVLSPEYVSSLYAAGRPLDASKYFLVFIDNVGHGASVKPSDGLHARFPKYGYRDMVDLQHRVVTEKLGISRLRGILGMSMGGMHAWMWAETYPDEVGAIMPVVALPAPIAGRNLVWRRIVARSIRTDPEWQNGEYTSPPRGWVEIFPMFRMMLDGVPHLQATVPDRLAADVFVQSAEDLARKIDANDVLYSLESSGDYAPEPALDRIHAKVFALNFSDDEFNPVALGILERSLARVPHGRYAEQPGNDASWGHLTQAHPALWSDRVFELTKDMESLR